MMEFNQENFNELAKMTEELKKLNTKLLESEKLKSQFLSNIRNEINNPITSILGLSLMLKRSDSLDLKDVRSLAGMIYSEAFYLNLQLKTIFAAADLEAGELAAEISVVKIEELIQGVIEEFQEESSKKNISLNLINKLTENDLSFKTDGEKLRLVLACLIANGIEFSAPGKSVTVKAEMDEDEILHVTVKDEGVGIPSSEQEKIFDRFVQLDSGPNKQFRGLGLGLSVAKSLVELLGGAINLASQPGKGSLFEIALPQDLYGDQMDDVAFDEEGFWSYDTAIDSSR